MNGKWIGKLIGARRSDVRGRVAMLLLHFRRHGRVVDAAKVLVSLTTYRARLPKFHLVLESLLRQDCAKDYSVVVHLSLEDLESGTLPSNIASFEGRGVSFVIHPENLRSYKKLVYEYGRSADTLIVTADDDILYPSYWLRRLLGTHDAHPGCVVAYRAHFLLMSGSGGFVPYSEMMGAASADSRRCIPSFDLMPTGVSGVLYPPGSLSDICLDKELFLAYAPSADDIWFKVSSLLKGTPCVQVEPRNRHFAMVPGSQTSSLYQENVGRSQNDVQLAECFRIFPELLQLIQSAPPASEY